jgi:hypothetical protein
MRVVLPKGDVLMMHIDFLKKGGKQEWVGIWNALKDSTTVLRQSIDFSIGESTLELAVPLSVIQGYLGDAPRSAEFDVANADANGTWLGNDSIGFARIAFGK